MKTHAFLRTSALVLAGAVCASAAVLAGCGGEDPPLELSSSSAASSTSAGAGGGSSTTSSSAGVGGSGGGVVPEDPYTPTHTWTECQASDQAFVRRAITALLGRRPWGQAEVNAYEDAIAGIRKADLEAAGQYGDIGNTLPPYGDDLVNARKLVAQAMMQDDAFRQRWTDFIMDSLHVVRIETKSQQDCYGDPIPSAIDNGSLAAWVRDNDAAANTPPLPFFRMGQLVSSALELDDLSPVYRAHLFAMLGKPYTAANVGPDELERSRRQNFGAIFEAAYIHRDLVCLSCHNSEFSVTYSEDPTQNRAWPVPGLFEIALYGASNGKHPASEEPTKGTDELRSRSMLKYRNVGDGGGSAPYGWSGTNCGTFKVPLSDDPLGVDTYFGSIKSTPLNPNLGRRASVWDLERALHRGIDLLAAHGLQRLEGGALADEDEAFAYLVAENVVEKVWAEVMGSRLTIANYFPRTQIQRDILMALTEHFIATHFSLKTLLLDILAHPAFNLRAPEEGCGVGAYEVPNIFDPWTTSEKDLSKRGNGMGDMLFAISSRPLRRSFHRAMHWPFASEYPSNTEETFQIAIGFFIKDAEPGYRGLDFQGRLSWESRYGKCAEVGTGTDLVERIVNQAQATAGATVGDGVVALKDRLVGEPWVDTQSEQPLIEDLLGTPLDSTNISNLNTQLRTLCGVLVATPQFMLGGMVPPDTRAIPKLTPPEITYDKTCNDVAGYLANLGTYDVTCGGSTTVTKK